jgi:hypothetical protein
MDIKALNFPKKTIMLFTITLYAYAWLENLDTEIVYLSVAVWFC